MLQRLKGIRFVPTALVGIILAVVYFFPRWIVAQWGAGDPWTSYAYHYGFGLLVFLLGIGIILKTGACQPGRGRDRLWLGVLFAGFALFAGAHALWIVVALNTPFVGGG